MQGEPGVDYPEDRSPVDVLAASRGDAVMCFVERIAEDEIVVTIGQDRSGRPVNLHAEERMELVWKDAGELRSLPAELVAVETGEQRVWRIRPVGPAARGQRRAAVRAPLSYRAVLEFGAVTTEGTTVDVSEGGVRALFDLSGPATGPDAAAAAEPDGTGGGSGVPALGAIVTVSVWFDQRQHVTSRAEVARHHARTDRQTELSLRFVALPEKMQDLVRREVFAGLRELRARGLL
jgi:c-di-GMP-binding flagellar brake protein YcgR